MGQSGRTEWRPPLCHCTGCVHTPGTQTENRPAARDGKRGEKDRTGTEERKRRSERGSERVSEQENERDEGRGKVAERVAKKESGGERGARNLRAGVLQPSWGVAARCIAYLPAEMHVLARRQVRATPPYPSHHFVVLLLVASPELASFQPLLSSVVALAYGYEYR